MSSDFEEFWAALPVKARHPVRVPILEALRWTGEPLSAIDTVDVLDGDLSMWETAYHLRVLEALGVIEPMPVPARARGTERQAFETPYRLTAGG